jgi:hypothetical protein
MKTQIYLATQKVAQAELEILKKKQGTLDNDILGYGFKEI